jgi:hydrogenase maturation factor
MMCKNKVLRKFVWVVNSGNLACMSKYGESVKVKTKQKVLLHTDKTGQKIGAFYDLAALEKIERDSKKKKV